MPANTSVAGTRDAGRVLLLVEDNPADADLVEELLDGVAGPDYDIVHRTRLGESIAELRTRQVDVVLLDLGLPDATGLATLRGIKEAAGRTPVIVLSGVDDEELAAACIAAGAQDCLFKSEIRPLPLRRALGYAVKRRRDEEVAELRDMLENYRRLSTETQGTVVTAAMARSGAIKARDATVFASLTGEYAAITARYIEHLAAASSKPREAMERLVTELGDLNAGPRDLVDIHIAALDRVVSTSGHDQSQAFTAESRLLALEMMGILVDYYRVGHRRLFPRRI